MKLLHVLTTLLLAISLVACGGSGEHKDHDIQDMPAETAETGTYNAPDSFKESLESVLDHYFELTDALVQSDAELAASHSIAFAASLLSVSADDLDDSASMFWAEQSAVASARADTIAGLQDVEEQRYQFEYASEAMIELVKAFGPLSYTVFQQRCPMVRDGSADWLSKENAILNPYHGDRMLRCGGIVREI